MITPGFQDYLEHKANGKSSRLRKSLAIRPNGRSTDFVAPGMATGCQLACSYCYVARHRAYGNPLEIYLNQDEIFDAVKKHYDVLPVKQPNQCDSTYWTYDIGESTDCLSPSIIAHTNWMVRRYLRETNAKPSFATKLAVWKGLMPCIVPTKARIRVSLAPQYIVDKTEKLTSKVDKRIKSLNILHDMGYEVHINFSPVILYSGWTNDYKRLFADIDKELNDAVKKQLKCEVIFLTHNYDLDTSNKNWFSESSDYLYKPNWQEAKTTERGDDSVVRYNQKIKPKAIETFRQLLQESIPYCSIRYIF